MREPLGIILAGGRGSRMGGLSKADLMLGDASLLTRVASRLEPQVAGLAVNTNAPVDTPLPTVADPMGGHLGPLAGVLAGLNWAAERGASHVVSVAVDTPFFPCDLVPQLLLAGNGGLAIAATADGPHPTFGLWPAALRADLTAFLKDGHRKVRQFTDQHGGATALFPETTPPSFFNINTPEDLAQAGAWVATP